MKAAVHLWAFTLFHVCFCVLVDRPSNGLGKCRASVNLSITALEVLPGGGWDNLRNMDMGRVMNLSYFQCQTTEDGFYLIPDEVFIIPRKETGVETNSEIIGSWLEERSSLSRGINGDSSYLPVLNGKYSVENQRMKTHQVKDSATTTRVQVRNLIYTAKVYPDFRLDFRFAQQVKEIADAIENNQTRLSDYLSEKMVLDYGTHVLTSVDAGATLIEEDYLRSSYISDNVSLSSTVKLSAGLNFFGKLKYDIDGQSTRQSSSLQAYQANIQYSLIQSHGGIPFYPGISLQKWQESTRNNLVAIDRNGFPLPYFINKNTFPDLPQPTIGKVVLAVSRGIERYYKVNSRPGCVDVNSKNFNFQANVNDSSCQGPATNLSFGGIYQVCTPISQNAGPLCKELAQKNPDTGLFSCNSPYVPTRLRTELRQQGYSVYQCYDQEYSCGIFGLFNCHRQVCQDRAYVRSANISTYWCSVNGSAPDNSGFLFGGIHGPSLLNPFTSSKSCPSNFYGLKFLSDGMVICVSRDYEAGTKFSVPFGGLFSCESRNPLGGGKRRCPPMFSQHLAAVSDGCEILYCVQSGLFTGGQLKPVQLPPFTRPPLISMLATNTVMVMTEGEKSWVRIGKTKMWKVAQPADMEKMFKSMNAESSHSSAGKKVGVAFAVLGTLALLVLGLVLLIKRRRLANRGYVEIREEDTPEAEQETSHMET